MDSCTIQLTPGDLKNDKLNIRPCGLDFFPKGILGGSSRRTKGTLITINAEGIPEPIKTDIPTDKKTGRPRWLFRERAWVRKFVKLHNLRAGDKIVIKRLSSNMYVIKPNGRNSHFIAVEKEPRIERHYRRVHSEYKNSCQQS